MAHEAQFTLLGTWLRNTTLNANTAFRPSAKTGEAELQRDEVAEVVFMEVFSPVTGGGVEQDLTSIRINPDNQGPLRNIYLSGLRSRLVTPPRRQMWQRDFYTFGEPVGVNPRAMNPLNWTTIKYTRDVTIEVIAGAANVTENFRIRLWGWKYKLGYLAQIPTFDPHFFINENPARGRRLDTRTEIATARQSVTTPFEVSRETWTRLPGGPNQQIPRVHPFAVYALNALATDGNNGTYRFRFQDSEVAQAEQELFFDFDLLDAILIEGVGVRSTTNLRNAVIDIAGNEHPDRPDRVNGWPTRIDNNDLHFGRAEPFLPADMNVFYKVPKIDQAFLIWNEIGNLGIQDDGTAVAANGVAVAVTGKRIEMRG